MPVTSWEPLSPTRFLDRSAAVFAGRTAVIDGDVELTYAELRQRVDALTGVLAARGIGPGDRVAALPSSSAFRTVRPVSAHARSSASARRRVIARCSAAESPNPP